MSAQDRFSRFKNIEKGRQEEASARPVAAPGRFGALERTPEAAPAAPSPVVPERFGPATPAAPPVPRTLEEARLAAQAPSGLELAEVRAGDQPFVRCASCHQDNHALAHTCASCGENLNTLEQRAFNERLWAEQRAALEKAAEPVPAVPPLGAAAPAAGLPIAGLDSQQQRALAEALAREAAAKARRVLGDDPGGFAGLGLGGGALVETAGQGLAGWFLHRVPPKVATAVVYGAIVVSGALMAWRHTRPVGFVLSLIVGLGLFALYLARDGEAPSS